MYEIVLTTLRTLNELLSAGVAITAFSLLLYALSFNLRDRVARSFALILGCVVIVFVGDALGSVAGTESDLVFWFRFQWLGIVFLPATFLHFSDALLATTGRPSRGRRRRAVQLSYLVSFGFLATMPFSLLVGPLVQDVQPAPHLERTWLTWVFTGYYAAVMLLSWINFWRAYQRIVASASRRRMKYFLTGSLAPALGSYPYLLFGSGFAAQHPLIFWLVVTLGNLMLGALLVLMAYSVAFFGVPWPDRVVKRRLFKWLMRGPVTASFVLASTTLLRRIGNRFGLDFSAIIPVVMVATILVFEHLITLVAPLWERLLFIRGDNSDDVVLMETMEERLLTLGDLQQFLEAVLAAACDRLQTPRAFVAALQNERLESLVVIGGDDPLSKEDLSAVLLQMVVGNGVQQGYFTWGKYWLMPLFDQEEMEKAGEVIGLFGVERQKNQVLDDEQLEALTILTDRAAMALRDRQKQQQVVSSLEALTPQIEALQRLRAASRFDGTEILTRPSVAFQEQELSLWVKDALTHYWGGPKLTESPLINLQIVQKEIDDHEDNPTNALRAILRRAIEQIRPEGERRFTAEWILYNIIEMKFFEGRKVREIAGRLAMSEADLYRKQRVAIEAVAKAIAEMERQADHGQNNGSNAELKAEIHP